MALRGFGLVRVDDFYFKQITKKNTIHIKCVLEMK